MARPALWVATVMMWGLPPSPILLMPATMAGGSITKVFTFRRSGRSLSLEWKTPRSTPPGGWNTSAA